MSRFAQIVAAAVLAALIACPATADELPRLRTAKSQKAVIACESAIVRVGATISTLEASTIASCSTGVLKCLQVAPDPPSCLEKAGAKCNTALVKLPPAQAKLAAKIVTSCSGEQLRLVDLLAGDGLGLGALGPACQSRGGTDICSGVPAVAQCLVDQSRLAAERLVPIALPRARELLEQAPGVETPLPLPDLTAIPGCGDCAVTRPSAAAKPLVKCATALTKAERTFALVALGSARRCLSKIFACGQNKASDPKCLAKADAGCQKGTSKLDVLRSKARATVAKSCGEDVLEFGLLLSNAGLNLEAIAPDCAAVAVPTLTESGDFATCAQRRSECALDELVGAVVPRRDELRAATTAGPLFETVDCPADLTAFGALAPAPGTARSPRTISSIAQFITAIRRLNGPPAGYVAGGVPVSAPGALRRVVVTSRNTRFRPGVTNRLSLAYVRGGGGFVRDAAAVTIAPKLLIVVREMGSDVLDHYEIALPAGVSDELELDFPAILPTCFFEILFATADETGVSDFTPLALAADPELPAATVTATPLPTATAARTATPAPTATAIASSTLTSSPTPTSTPAATATSTSTAPTSMATPSATATITPTASPPPIFSYALTTASDPVGPGQVAEFTVTVTNLSTIMQNVKLSYAVPDFTTGSSGHPAGSTFNLTFNNVAAGASRSGVVNFTVLNGTQAPPDGAIIHLTMTDVARAASISRDVVVQSAPAVDLEPSTAQATVAPGGSFAYTFTYHNFTPGMLSGLQLSVPLPAGATFMSADGTGMPDVDGVVHWALDPLAAGGTGHVTLNAKAAPNSRAALLVEATVRDAGDQVLARASSTTAVYAAPVFAYALTTTTDPVGPNQVAEFTVTVTNLTEFMQTAQLLYRVPNFTTNSSGFGGGAIFNINFNVAARASQSTLLNFSVLAPPDGAIVGLTMTDNVRGASVSRNVVVQSAPVMDLELSTAQGTVAPGEPFAYTFTYHNFSAGMLSGLQLTVPLPVGASFTSADGDGMPDADGVVHWTLAPLAAGGTGHVTLNATAPPGGTAALLMEVVLRDAANQVLAQASATTPVYAAPVFSYALTSTTDPVSPGAVAQFNVMVSNHTNGSLSAQLSVRDPSFTTGPGGFAAGNVFNFNVNNVPANGSKATFLNFDVLSGGQAPPDDAIINVVVTDTARGAAVSSSILVQQ